MFGGAIESLYHRWPNAPTFSLEQQGARAAPRKTAEESARHDDKENDDDADDDGMDMEWAFFIPAAATRGPCSATWRAHPCTRTAW